MRVSIALQFDYTLISALICHEMRFYRIFFPVRSADASATAKVSRTRVRPAAEHPADAGLRSLHLSLRNWTDSHPESLLDHHPRPDLVPIRLHSDEPGTEHGRGVGADM